jgi:hypothetical protein
MFSVYCFRFMKPAVLISSGHTLSEAQAICRDPETSSKTSTNREYHRRFSGFAGQEPWFFGYREEE